MIHGVVNINDAANMYFDLAVHTIVLTQNFENLLDILQSQRVGRVDERTKKHVICFQWCGQSLSIIKYVVIDHKFTVVLPSLEPFFLETLRLLFAILPYSHNFVLSNLVLLSVNVELPDIWSIWQRK